MSTKTTKNNSQETTEAKVLPLVEKVYQMHAKGLEDMSVGIEDEDSDGKKIAKIGQQFQRIHRDLAFQVDETSGEYTMVISDRRTGSVVVQIPGQDLDEVAGKLGDRGQIVENNRVFSVLVDKKT